MSESIILEALLNQKGSEVKDVMQEAPPIVSKTTSMQVVSNLLKHYPMVLVSEGGRLVGLITKSDLLERLYKG
ncbi:CBS domain-containing protein [Candidatus Woesearchaeota archaeon]|nr:CBS domain-containing protein [Candidatus Woesearchaeota archaeon]